MEFVLTLGEALKGLKEQPTPEHLELGASLFLIPLEYQTINRIVCPQCASHEWETVVRESLAPHAQMKWPYSSPGGDRHHCQCKKCRHNVIVTFWFTN